MSEPIREAPFNPKRKIIEQAQQVLDQGKEYGVALRTLDSALSQISEDDKAVGFDVGSGADAIAFKELGFKHAIVTNSPSVKYQMMRMGQVSEEDIQNANKDHFPEHTYYSDMAISDWLGMKNFSPRLLTMLRMAPQYFDDDDDPAYFLKTFIPFVRQMKPNGVIILSAMDDHPLSEKAFRSLHEQLNAEKIKNKLFLDNNVPSACSTLGERVMVIYGNSEESSS